MNPPVSLLSIRCNSQSSHWNARQCRLLGAGEGEARPLDMPQGKNKRLPKSLAEREGYCGSCLARSSSGGENGNFALIKRHPGRGASPPNGLALTFREYTGNEVLQYSGHSEGSWSTSIYQFHPNDLLLLIDQSEPVALGFQEDGRRSSHLLGPQLGSTHMQWGG